MGKRTNTAVWEEKYSRWRVAVQKDIPPIQGRSATLLLRVS